MKFLLLGAALLAAPAFAQKPHSSLPPLNVPDGAGVNIHFTDPKAGEMKMLADGGFRVIRMDFFWGGTEREKGVYDFSAFDRLVKACEAHKIKLLFILDYNNRHYDQGLSPYTDEGRAAFAKWAAAAASHFKGRGILWEMYNEPNIGFWKPQPKVEDYILLDKAVAAAIRKAAPGECYFGAATSTIDLKFLEACFKSGALERWDAVSVHPYRQKDPETAASEYRQLRLLIERYKPKGKAVPILSGEWGYSTAWGGFNDERQGKYLPRQWMTNLMNEVPLSIWYDWHDDGDDPKEAEHNFGTVEFEYHAGRDPIYNPKLSYKAARALTQFFNGYNFNKRLAMPSSDDYVLLFEKNGAVKLAAWTTGAPHEITIPASPGTFKVTNYLGEEQATVSATNGLKLRISDAPLYLEPVAPNEVLRGAAQWKRLPLETLVKAPARVPVSESPLNRASAPQIVTETKSIGGQNVTQSSMIVVTNPLNITVMPAGFGQVDVRLENPSGDAFSGNVSLHGAATQLVTFAPGQTEKTLRFSLTGETAQVRFQGLQKDDVVTVARTFRPLTGFAALTTNNLNLNYRVAPDGDPKIESEQTLSIGQPLSTPPGGGPVLQLSYRFAPGWKFAQIQPLLPEARSIEGQPKALGMWVYGDGSNNVLRMRFRDKTGQTFQPHGTPISWTGWRYYEFPIDNSGGNWGGDGQIHWPISLDTLALLDSTKAPNNKGTIYIAAPVWVY
jgi:polysaccharide biosynthesis protein PslG